MSRIESGARTANCAEIGRNRLLAGERAALSAGLGDRGCRCDPRHHHRDHRGRHRPALLSRADHRSGADPRATNSSILCWRANPAGTCRPPSKWTTAPRNWSAAHDTHRPLVLVSSSGTKVIHEAAGCEAIYLGCFRSYSMLAGYLAGRHARVAVIGAGSKGEFREEDQICCAWIAAGLMSQGLPAGSCGDRVAGQPLARRTAGGVPGQPERRLPAAHRPN